MGEVGGGDGGQKSFPFAKCSKIFHVYLFTLSFINEILAGTHCIVEDFGKILSLAMPTDL